MARRRHLAALAVLLWFAPLAYGIAAPCPDLTGEAGSIAALRDSDPGRGVTRGEQVLEGARGRAPRCAVGEAMLLAAIGNNLHILGRVDEAVARYEQALILLPDDATPAQRATVHRGAGVALADADDYVQALERYLEALSASQAAGDTLEAAKTAGNIGNLYNTLGELDRAGDYHQQALAGFQAAGFAEGVAGTSLNLAAVALKVAQNARRAGNEAGERRATGEAIGHHRQALAIFTELGNERGIGHAETSIAQGLVSLGRAQEALPHYQRALDLHRRVGDLRGEIQALLNMAEALILLGRHDQAKRQLDTAADKLPDNVPGLAMLIANARVNLAESQGRYAEALDWQRESNRLSTAISDEQYNTRVLELQGRFDTRQQAQEIQLLRSQAEIRELVLLRQRLVLAIAIIVVVLVVALVAVLYSRLRLGRRAAGELRRAAETDPVTGLANRRHMIERIDQLIRRMGDGDRSFSVVMIDIDRFKSINDRFGHGVGDEALQEVARRLGSRLRGQDLLARWGGEEFLVLLPNTGLCGGRVVAENLRDEVASRPMRSGSFDIHLSISLGVCEYRAGMKVDDCVNQADNAMYAGKRQGGNRVGNLEHEAQPLPGQAGAAIAVEALMPEQ